MNGIIAQLFSEGKGQEILVQPLFKKALVVLIITRDTFGLEPYSYQVISEELGGLHRQFPGSGWLPFTAKEWRKGSKHFVRGLKKLH